ncbi:nitrite/sulfite reductase [Clostridium boliviensis]|uniref:Nitrite/sulfite reductase n=1 Tax=Clostridium boliviensis TaxID=318465 RepID=A0ABU4GSL4_9CLOT|nr:nitrite/sulfite reductase [Clostridium boliviensis]MDW2800634.1 nitrite/sulfite reductase [Clostridium boliviensis]
MNEYNKILKEEIAEFREAGHKFVNKEITTAEFKGKSGGMGVYAQRGGEAFMIRLRIPCGIVSFAHLKLIHKFAVQYGLQRIHLTTRQAIQLHDLDIDSVCDIMETAIDHGLYSRGGGGNYPRNVALSPLSGVDKTEAFDPTPYAMQVNRYVMERIREYHLPHKLKIAFSNNEADTANCTINDLGFMSVMDQGKPFFKMFLAGGLGNNPAVALPYDELILPDQVLYHVEAVTRIFVAEGDYQNKAKARMRYIPKRMGEEAFMECYKKHLAQVTESMELNINVAADGIYESADKMQSSYIHTDSGNLIAQKQEGFYTAVIHPQCGQLPVKALEEIITFLVDKQQDIRLSMTESMYIRNLSREEGEKLLALMEEINQVTRIGMSVSCVGVPTCQIGVLESQTLLKEINRVLMENRIKTEYLPGVSISGCFNSCSRHQISEIGFDGCKKRISDAPADAFELHIGGAAGSDNTHLGKCMGAVKKEDIPNFVMKLSQALNTKGMYFMDYLKGYREEFEDLVKPYLIP